MSEAVIIAIIAGIVSIANTLMMLLVKTKVKELGKQIDGQQTALIAAVKGEAHAVGELKGQADKQAEITATIIPPVIGGEIDVNIKSVPKS